MINTKFMCIDNTGVQEVKCIRIISTSYIEAGTILLVVIRRVKPHKKIKKGQLYRALVVRFKKLNIRKGGIAIKYKQNAIILFKKHELMPLGTRIFGSIFFEVRLLGFMKIVSLALFLV